MQAMGRLNKSKVQWIVRQKRRGRLTNGEIASTMNVSASWVQKIARRYGGGVKPADIAYPGPAGRPASTLPGGRGHSAVLSAKGRLRHGACKIEGEIERSVGIYPAQRHTRAVEGQGAGRGARRKAGGAGGSGTSAGTATQCGTPTMRFSRTADGS